MWNIEETESELKAAFENNSEIKLLKTLKNNSFLFYELYERKYGIQPNFCEVPFGDGLKCDFTWLNDSSDGPEWVLIEIEKPIMKLFTKKGDPSAELNHAIEQVKSWNRYFKFNPNEKERIFGAVSKFRFVMVGGSVDEWHKRDAAIWRSDHNQENFIEIRSSDVFMRSLKIAKDKPEELWSFKQHPKSLKPSKLKGFWKEYAYMDIWRNVL